MRLLLNRLHRLSFELDVTITSCLTDVCFWFRERYSQGAGVYRGPAALPAVSAAGAHTKQRV